MNILLVVVPSRLLFPDDLRSYVANVSSGALTNNKSEADVFNTEAEAWAAIAIMSCIKPTITLTTVSV